MRDSEDGAAADEAGGDSTIWVHQTHVLLQVRPSNAALGSRATARCVRTRSMSWSWAWRSVALGTRPASVGLDHALCFHCRAPKEPWASAALVQLMIEAQPLSHLRYPPPLPCPGPEWGRTPMRQYAHHAQTLRGLRPGHRALPDELCAQRRQCMRDPKWNTRR